MEHREDQLSWKKGFFSNWQLTMAIPHWLLLSALFLLPLLAQVSAQEPGKLFHEVLVSEECLPWEGVALVQVAGC